MNCKNCHTELPPNSDFCNHCGAKVIRNRLTFRNLFEHISETFFNYDNKLLRTFLDLFARPDVVIGGYISGIRKRYVNPISYFGLAITLTGIYLLTMNKFFPEAMDFSNFAFEGQEEIQRRNMNFVQEYMSLFMMLYIPIYALIAKVTFVGLREFNYTEMLVVFLYWQSQVSIVSALLGVLGACFGIANGLISMSLLPLMVIYAAYMFKKLYKLTFGHIIIRTLLFFGVGGAFFVVLSIVIGIVMFLNGDMQQIMEAQEAARQASQ